MSAEISARSVRQAEGLDPVRALQRVLYRSAKQDHERRFHALYGHVARSDVLWQAWVDVASNNGAPGIDGVSIESIEADGVAGVRAFLDDLAAQLKAGTYRPKALRRVYIPKAGDPAGKASRPLSIPDGGGPGGYDGGEDRARADLRSRLSAHQFRVPPETVHPPGSRSRPPGGQPGSGVGA